MTLGFDALFLDAGGVLVYPSWSRVSDALARHGVVVDAASLARAEPIAKRELDVAHEIYQTTDAARVPRYFDLVLPRAGVSPARTVHVGDLFHVDVVGARAAGIRGVLFDAADLYRDHDCPRVRTLTVLVDLLEAGDPRPFGTLPPVPP